ncbi:hypothetical protein PPL_02100 [Heterostelium album PN500]|uniref:Complex 1 LYR protein domain-containing protein n=1 Tax=Heterostelium pallidum (strain ATCC 26659 / Pp 5 / PN500) TaxID=670386 RepID=D3B1C9_HETP5|nr:hypothetical protein PPL_02100 [Heterostelium album PN500]EFA85103.1 hypothetical protein PPL_02100 [Heterostelium album PN500]|eukprot:XP_020437212.1 hypothetical protein PPL_02100 [Heterostelium album PN500]
MNVYSSKNCLNLYRDLIRGARLLMVDVSRKDRSLSGFATKTIREKFRENQKVSDLSLKKHLYEQAQVEFNHMKSLVENQSVIKYPCSIKIRPDVVQKSKILLSSNTQEKMKKNKWGFMDRLMVVFSI